MSELTMRWVATAAGAAHAAPDTERVPLGGLLLQAGERPSPSIYLFLRPAGVWYLLPIEEAIASRGIDVLAVSTRYARNEALAVAEYSLLDIGAWVRFARETLGYRQVNLLGWSGSGTQSAFYQEQAARPTITATPDGSGLDLAAAGLEPADGLVFLGAHVSRARMLADMIDPSVIEEDLSTARDPAFDLYGAMAPEPPFDPAFIASYRAAQLARIRRITAFARRQIERGLPDPFIVPRTLADPHFLDSAIDPNERPPGRCWLGVPRVVNEVASGIARVTTPEAWLSQWSIADSNVDAVRSASAILTPLLVIENGADDAVPPRHLRDTFETAASRDKTYLRVPGASHSYQGQPDALAMVADAVSAWASERH